MNIGLNCLTPQNPSGSKTIGDLLRSNSEIQLPSEFLSTSNEIQSEVLYRVKYEGYLNREINNISKFNNIDKVIIPKSFKYDGLPGLRGESIEKLTSILPLTLGQASRIPGVNPSDIDVLNVMIQKHVSR